MAALSNEMRGKIKRYLVYTTFKDRHAALASAAKQIGDRVYLAMYDSKMRSTMDSIDPVFTQKADHFAIHYYLGEDTKSVASLALSKPRMFPYRHIETATVPFAIDESWKGVYEHVRSLERSRRALKDEEKSFERQFDKYLKQCRTYKVMLEGWPALQTLLPPDLQGPPPKNQLPAIRSDELDAVVKRQQELARSYAN